jgi:hypothetical protein
MTEGGRVLGKTMSMWRQSVTAAQEGMKVLVCVHKASMRKYLGEMPLDDEGTTISNIAKRSSEKNWRFDNGGQIIIHVPKQLLVGHRFNVVAIDHEARWHFTIGEWWDSILPRLDPGFEQIVDY